MRGKRKTEKRGRRGDLFSFLVFDLGAWCVRVYSHREDKEEFKRRKEKVVDQCVPKGWNPFDLGGFWSRERRATSWSVGL